MQSLISIAICTYRRPTLARTLQSLEQLLVPENTRLEILIVDNDEKGFARQLTQRFSARVPHEVFYRVERRKGLSSARNHALSLARGELLIFIDDDERADPNWLAQLYSVANRYSAHAVIGSVKPEFEEKAPSWIARSRFFEPSLPKTGERVGVGDALSGNALLDMRFVRLHELRFDEAFNATGGEDSDFFHQFLEIGGSIVSAREAVVYEFIPRERMTAHYMSERSLRVGESYARMRHRHGGGAVIVAGVLRAGFNVLASTILTAATLPFGSSHYYRFYLLLVRNLGKFRYYFGLPPIEMYK